MAAPVLRSVSEFEAQQLSHTSWSLAPRACEHRPLIAALSAASLNLMPAQFEPRNISSLLWSFAKLTCAAVPLLDALGCEACERMETFSMHEVATTAWALAKLAFRDSTFWASMSCRSIRNSST
mmetsp:Transcript_45893/g.146428  ORF Transcript_45893/g.146428 Transcript_45893/m.146428 type:complete len:124 (-) Transcript_45893:8-379(-)